MKTVEYILFYLRKKSFEIVYFDDRCLMTGDGGLSYGAIFSIIDGTNCSPKAVLV
jgi:hypothetical protein